MKSRLAFALATWFGCGYAPRGPGTAGSLAAVIIAALLVHFAAWPAWWFAILAIVCTPVGIWSASVVARESGGKDPQIVVIDEVLGQWITLAGASTLNWKTLALGLALFRLFDIWKPPPVRQLEKLPAGTGIVADDLMAGVYGAIVLALLRLLV